MTKEKILICDDQESLCRVLGFFLDSRGFETLIAKDGEECLQILNDTPDISCVILDVQMPKMNGIDVLKTLQEKNRNIDVILTTGFSGACDCSKARDLGACDFIPKPFDLHRLLETIKSGHPHKQNKLLIVDDETLLRNMLQTVFEKQGFHIEVAKNGREAVALAEDNDYRAIFMDIRMPEMDGVSAMQVMRHHGVKTPIILMTGYTEEVSSIEDAKSKGANAFMKKPFTAKNAISTLTNLVDT